MTFTAGTDKGSYDNAGNAGDKVTKDGITIETTSGNSAFAAAQYRFSKNSVTTFSSTVGNITKVVFTCTANGTTKYGPGCFSTPSDGTYTYSGKTGTWTGDATSFTLKASSNQVRATKIEVTYTPPTGSKTATTLSFADPANKTFYTGDKEGTDFTNIATLSPAIEGATITYTSSDENIAVVVDGQVTVDTDKPGSTTITASYAGNDEYAPSSASYIINIKKSLNLTGKGTEDDPYTVADALTIIDNNETAEHGTGVYVKGIISSITSKTVNSKYGSLNYNISDDEAGTNTINVYGGLNKNSAKFTSVDDIAVGDIVLIHGDLFYYNNKTEEINLNNTLEKFYEREMVFDENKDLDVAAGHNVNVTLGRTFNAEAWNTLVLPFSLTAEQVTSAFGENTKVANYISTTAAADGTYTLNFETTTTIDANKPVFIYGADKDVTAEVKGVTVVSGGPTNTPDGAAFSFVGTYSNTTVKANDWFISSDNNFYYSTTGTEAIKPMRAVFRPTTTTAAAKCLKISVDGGAPTAISKISVDGIETEQNAPAYNLAGQRVGKNYKGIVVRNGRKYINK